MPHMRRSPKARLFLQALEHRITPSYGEFVDPHPAAGNQFGATILALSTGNVVVTSPYDDVGGVDAGAVYLFNGSTGQLISTLRGSTAGDNVGGGGFGGVTALTNGNYVVRSPSWHNGAVASAGAVTWGNGNTGAAGVVSAANSLVGSTAGDQVGGRSVTALSNGNYVVCSTTWDNGTTSNVGAVTWADGTNGTVGVVSAANSLVGGTAGDTIGSDNVTALTNGNYVVCSGSWDKGATNDAGAVTWGNGAAGTAGVVSTANSLVGSKQYDSVGYGSVTALTNGNYVVWSYSWDNGPLSDASAVTWCNGTTATAGVVSASNSLVGGKGNDSIGAGGVFALPNGNYVVSSPYWDNGALVDSGAVTWCDGNAGLVGLVSASNSLVGGSADDRVGVYNGGVTLLANGNYVVSSPVWDNGAVANVGAVTWGNANGGTIGVVSVANSLIGNKANDQVGLNNDSVNVVKGVTALTNGNYVVRTFNWDNGAVVNVGAVTWGNGSTGTAGVVSAANSLVGSTANDQVGLTGVTALANGHYVVGSQLWHNGGAANAGAVTWGNGNTGTVGAVSAANSLVGSQSGDNVGVYGGSANAVTALSNGNYVVCSPSWANGAVPLAGAATWGNGSTGTVGAVSTANSLVGSKSGDSVGRESAVALTNGNYVVRSSAWDNGAVVDAGAVTWGNGTTGTVGAVSTANSLYGGTGSDSFGSGSVTAFANGNYVVTSPVWQNGAMTNAGAATFGKGGGGSVGLVNSGNSAMGAAASTALQSAITDNVNGTFISRFSTEGGGRIRFGSQTSGFLTPPPTVTGITFGDGTNQRSLVKQIVVTFSESVNFSGSVASAFTLHRTGTGGTTGDVTLSTSATSPTNTVTLTFSGSLSEYGSLVDGLYDFTISAAQVSGAGGALDGNNDGIAGGSYSVTGTTANKFFRLFGDSDGDGAVHQTPDYVAFRTAYGVGPSTIFDFDGDSNVLQSDYVAFRLRFNQTP